MEFPSVQVGAFSSMLTENSFRHPAVLFLLVHPLSQQHKLLLLSLIQEFMSHWKIYFTAYIKLSFLFYIEVMAQRVIMSVMWSILPSKIEFSIV